VDAHNESELAALAAKVEELSRVCARLSQENAQLHGIVAGMTAVPAPARVTDRMEGPPVPVRPARHVSGPMSRRSIGKALGVAAAGVVGAAVLTDATAGSAAAAPNPPLLADQGNNVEAGTGVEYDGTTNPGAIFAADDAGSFGGALLGAALSGHSAAILGNGTAHVNNGVFGNTAHPDGGDGVVGANNSGKGTGVHGIVNNGSANAIGVHGENSIGVAVVGTGGALGVLGSGATGVQATGGTLGVFASGTTGVHGSGTSGNGVTGSSSTASGVHGTGKNGLSGTGSGNNSVGVRGTATSSGGRGGILAGNAAQLKLVPGSKSSHPSSGQRGDLYADSKGRLWFCKGGTSWHQLA
jgi:hypothetical protein